MDFEPVQERLWASGHGGLTSVQIEELCAILDRLVRALHPECVYLYGSRARGDARPDSDVDLLVIVTHSVLPPHRREQEALRHIGWHTLPVDISILTRAEFDARAAAPASLPATVLREGALIYAAAVPARRA